MSEETQTAIIERRPNGQFASLPSHAIPFTSETARQLAHKRWDAARQAAAKGLAAAAAEKGLRVASGEEAWGEVVKIRAGFALDPGSGRTGTDAARFVGQAAGYIGAQADDEQAPGARIDISTDALIALAAALADRNGGESG